MTTTRHAVTARPRSRAHDRVRAHRVVRIGLEPCDVCGGTDDPSAPLDETLECQCPARRAELLARVTRLAHDRMDVPVGGRDRVAP